MPTTYAEIIGRSDTPKIAGSSAGFIALIVFLIVILLVSAAAIAFLLCDECTSNNLRRFTRRRRRSPYQQRAMGTSPYAFDVDPGPQTRTWAKRLIPFFAFRSMEPSDLSAVDLSGSKPARDGRGSYQAGSGDSWDYTTPQLAEAQGHSAEPYPYPASGRSISPLPTSDLHERSVHGSPTPKFINNSPGSSDARLDQPDSRNATQIWPPVPSESWRNSSSLLSSNVFFSSPSPSPTSTPIRANSMSPRPTSVDDLSRRSPIPHLADSSSGEMALSVSLPRRTFEGGSKFLEAL